MLRIPKLNLNINKLLIISGVVTLIFVVAFFAWWQSNEIIVDKDATATIVKDSSPVSPISGIACDNAQRRPIAIMLSSDPYARPLSAIGLADIVFEMQVTPSGVTRAMAVYQCSSPEDIGSIRSAREDFIPLVAGLGAIYAHWGGEHEALKKLDSHIVDNIDAMVYENIYFYRKAGKKQPHNGFARFDKLLEAAGNLRYTTDSSFTGYPHSDKKPTKNIATIVDSISIEYPAPFNILWKYEGENKIYRRFRDDRPETDKLTDQQVSASVIAVLETKSHFVSKDYMNVDVTGQGNLKLYQNGIIIGGYWKKDPAQLGSKLYFYDNDGVEIQLVPGKIWVEIVTNSF